MVLYVKAGSTSLVGDKANPFGSLLLALASVVGTYTNIMLLDGPHEIT